MKSYHEETKMKKVLLCFVIAVICIWSPWCKKPESAAKVDVIDGIEYVHNTETPLHPDKTVAFEEELSLGSEDKKGKIVLFRPSWHVVDEKEVMYICDIQDLQIKVFDPEGHLVRTIGQKGSGPGEFQNIGEIALVPDGRLLVLDWEAHRISLFGTDGNFINSHKYLNWSYDVFLTTDSTYARDERIFGPKTQLFVKSCDFSGRELFSYGKFEPHHSQDIKEAGQWFSVSLPFDVHSIFAGDQKNTWLYHCLNDKYLIEVYDQNGKLFRKIDRPYNPLPVRSEDKRKYLEGFSNVSERDLVLIEKNVEMPSARTVTDRMAVDDLGNLWVETNEEKEEQGHIFTAYDIFNEDGFYEAKVWLDISLGLIRKGKMYTREADKETGYRMYKRYRITWSDQ
jgi:hypothetical protein